MAGSIFDGIDMSNPCEVWPVMQAAYDRLLAGEQVVNAKFGSDNVEFQAGNVTAMKSRIAELKRECAAKCGGRPARHAIRAGFLRP